MRLSSQRRGTVGGMNMTPMIDIVFLLIIFFMTVSQITRVMDHPVELPEVEVADRSEKTPVKMTINIDRDGNFIVAGETYTVDETIQMARKTMQDLGNDPALLKVLVRCDRDCRSRHVSNLVEGFTEFGIAQVRLSVRGQSPGNQ